MAPWIPFTDMLHSDFIASGQTARHRVCRVIHVEIPRKNGHDHPAPVQDTA